MGDRLGQQLGNYRLVKLLGKGGFAEVYLGQHVRLASKQAAVKILHLLDVDAHKFQEEAETTEKLVHPHIVRLLDFDIEQDTPFLVLDFAPGGSLRTRHPKGSIVPLARVGEYLKELAPALQYAHDLHILHRDIKPDNVLIGRQGELLLSDFGIAVLSQTGRTSLEAFYGIGGTPYYMAPEAYRGKPEKASDQYALAVVVYEWLCGSVPFSEGNFIQLGYQHAHEPMPPLRERNPAIPPEVEAVIMKVLAKEPKDRYASVQEFATALDQASQHQQQLIAVQQPVNPPQSVVPITLEDGLNIDAPQKYREFVEISVASCSLGIIILGNDRETGIGKEVVWNLIHINDPLPTRQTIILKSFKHNQEVIELKLIENMVQGDQLDDLSMGKEIGQLSIPLPPELPIDAPIEITFQLDTDGRLRIIMHEPSTNTEFEVTTETEYLKDIFFLKKAKTN